MSRTTGPILAIGAITFVNQTVLNGAPLTWKVPVATAVAAGLFSLGEKVQPDIMMGIAAVALVTVLFARVDPRYPAPVESFLKFAGG